MRRSQQRAREWLPTRVCTDPLGRGGTLAGRASGLERWGSGGEGEAIGFRLALSRNMWRVESRAAAGVEKEKERLAGSEPVPRGLAVLALPC